MNEKEIDWSEIRLFLAVAREGGLSAAARRAGSSPPTLSRRMRNLEEHLGCRLFDRLGSGYRLTARGRDLLARAEDVEAAVLRIERWRDKGATGRTVRLSAGSWMTLFLTRHVGELVKSEDRFSLSFVSANRRLDIARREADIGIRNHRPSESWLAGRNIGRVTFAPYAASGADGREGWIVSQANTPSAQWVRGRHADGIFMEVSDPRTVLDLVERGAGRAVLPCFIGDTHPGLKRTGPVIEDLIHAQWIVAHHDDRHEPAIRQILKRTAKLITRSQALFRGEATN